MPSQLLCNNPHHDLQSAELTILCSEIPRSTVVDCLSRDMLSYMAASMSQKAIVLSPTSACTPQTHLPQHHQNSNLAQACRRSVQVKLLDGLASVMTFTGCVRAALEWDVPFS